MSAGETIFSQLMDSLPTYEFRKCVDRYNGNYKGPHEPFSWRQWQFIWEPGQPGGYTIMARATDYDRRQQPMNARWNVLGYSNNGVREHAVTVHIR
jgi:hypothetical protein